MRSDVSSETKALLVLSMLRGVGSAALRKIGTVKGLGQMSLNDLWFHLPRKLAENIGPQELRAAADAAEKQIDLSAASGTRILSSADEDYPRLLADTRDDPQLLFVKGHLAQTPELSVAVIGTREPTNHGKVIAQRLTGFFVGEGWSVVSGLAIGCDAIAHEAALDSGGHTVAVMAHGLQTIAPSRHKRLAERILESGGALVTEYRFGQEPMATNFVKRDRIQAGLARGVVMVQSDVTGGSLHASRAAIDYGRWLAVPFPTDQDIRNNEPKVQGNLLLADGLLREKADLLRCGPSDLKNLLILRSRDDYQAMLRPAVSSKVDDPPTQGRLL
ncbi:MAG: DNA-protecting protein DprA [Rhodobacteraceae bacterium]|nr:DNA-protecting protein DprA [Paracoccaceae bacterium]MCZ8084994.1 DNA-protecting protein DprA [Paracoccaceae bacterium]